MDFTTLSNGVQMPMLGYGVYQVSQQECERCVLDALKTGYRSLDTAQSYYNEEQVGLAIKKSGIPRNEIFLTTKVWVEHYGYEAAKASAVRSMQNLQTDYLDLLLLHQPLLQPFRLHINKLHLCRPVKYMIRNTFQNGGFQDGKHRILNAFDMLNIQRGINVHARLQ